MQSPLKTVLGTLGEGSGRYRKKGQKSNYVRQAGFDLIQQEQMVLTYIEKHGFIKRSEVMELCRITKDQAYKLLKRLSNAKKILKTGDRKAAVYMRHR